MTFLPPLTVPLFSIVYMSRNLDSGQGSPQEKLKHSAGCCDHINHFGYHIKEIWILKAWGAAMLKGPGENAKRRESRGA